MNRLDNATHVIPPADDPLWNAYEKRDGVWYEVVTADNDWGDIEVDEGFVLEWVDEYGFQIVEREED